MQLAGKIKEQEEEWDLATNQEFGERGVGVLAAGQQWYWKSRSSCIEGVKWTRLADTFNVRIMGKGRIKGDPHPGLWLKIGCQLSINRGTDKQKCGKYLQWNLIQP